ncbi:Protein cubitus interruptus [Camponotus floridanus]|uniref:Protein cubitus interruptus n=1 Tax=Camponotus floridanus TaxID=104421 RepID=E2AB00_CAMFO|nr:Protein cubitus interruptus [Camponotus floridanus]
MVTPNSQIPNMHSAQQSPVINQCGPMSHCSQLNLTNQSKPINTLTTNLQNCQQPQQSTPCLQITNCVHPNGVHRQINDSGISKRTSSQLCNTQQTNCKMQQQQPVHIIVKCAQCRDISQSQQSSPVKPPQGMRHDSYRRTLEYVQQCKNWSGNAQTHETNVSSSTHPISLPQPLPASANMVVNDMTSSLSSLLEENRYLQMIQ